MDERRNPDALLERVNAEQGTRGRLKIYLGMAAGSGKTFSMLSDALIEMKRGADVAAGYIEPHGRVETEQLASQIEHIRVRIVEHKDIRLHEFDLDAALERRPTVLLVDELAHTNAPGSRHAKRWQDVEECLAHGITVYTTLNVQHVESLSDVVTKITAVPVQETVPDIVIRRAEEIELIDITPEELIQRLREGKIYVREKVETALNHFFKRGNLIALRELVLRLTAERVDEQLSTFRRQHEVREVWPTKPRVLVCVSPNFLSEKVVRTAWRLASSMQTELVAVTIESSSSDQPTEEGAARGETSIDLAERLGATIVRRSSEDIVAGILAVAREKNASMVVVGKSLRSRLRDYLFGSVVDELIRRSGELNVYVITDRAQESNIPFLFRPGRSTQHGVLKAVLLAGVTTAFCALAERFLAPSNLVMFYLLAVAWAGAKLGRLESIVTSIVGILAFDFFFVPPRGTFAVADVQYIVTFIVVLAIGLLISTLTLRLKSQAELVSRRERRTASLYEVSKLLARATTRQQVAKVVKEKSIELFGCEGVLFVPSDGGVLSALVGTRSGFEKEDNEVAVARWVSDRNLRAGAGTDTLAGAKAMYAPLVSERPSACVLGIYRYGSTWDSDRDSLLDAFLNQIGSALVRVFADEDATRVEIEVERERVRNVLLSAVSHDFRTPLTAIIGAADTALARHEPGNEQNRELLNSIKQGAEGLSRLVRNVLDLTRVESGEVQLQLDWESIEELVGSALERTSALLKPRSVSVELSSSLPLVRVDPSLMVQVFVNLFENVAKHTPPQTKVNVRGEVRKSELMIRVMDTGPGLPRGAETRVFEKAYRGSSQSEGFGLGLTICQAILRAHSGGISAMNRPEGGAAFDLFLPLSTTQPEVPGGS